MRFKHLAICAAIFAGGLSVPAMAYDTPPELMMVVPPRAEGQRVGCVLSQLFDFWRGHQLRRVGK